MQKTETIESILIVDDEPDICQMLQLILKKEDFEVAYATTKVKGLEKIASRAYTIFFFDLNLPDGSGFDLVREVQQKNIDAKIIVMSAYDSELEKTKLKSFGISRFIRKPFSRMDIMNAIKV